MAEEFRSYELVVRHGGDEFVCGLAGVPVAEVRERFRRLADRLTESSPDLSFSVGLSEQRAGDTLEALIDRAGGAMIDARRAARDAAQHP